MKLPSNQRANTPTNPEQAAESSDSGLGWYLYGITLRESASRLDENLTAERGEPLHIVEQGRLAAVTRLVPRDAFSPEALQARAQDIIWLEEAVRNHNEVVERIYHVSAVLPGKFGAVYPTSEALQAALAETHDALLAQLERLQHRDEWGIHLYADRQAVQRLAGEHPSLRQLQDEMAAASPGRAYLLKRKMADAMTDITEQALSVLAQTCYRRLAGYAAAGQISPRPPKPADRGDEREVLHAAFLVERGLADDFLREIQRLVQEQEGTRCEYSGPWPPYSFASIDGEEQP
ncbi:MAG TPA: GvpL/GvpF family gas vesicle protein [Ktedonobacterales bacterium]|nr:GvpL/GvpF family gas vesicle protein [Ktedonobacterales bacterium]